MRTLTEQLQQANYALKRLAQTYKQWAEEEKERLRQFRQTLAKHEVRPFKAEGQPFNPERHEAVSIHNQPDLPPNTVAHTTQTGYTIGDRVLRPARVVVTGDGRMVSG